MDEYRNKIFNIYCLPFIFSSNDIKIYSPLQDDQMKWI